jgi:hypothetical protein
MGGVLDSDSSAQQSKEDDVARPNPIGHGQPAAVPLAELLHVHLNYNK